MVAKTKAKFTSKTTKLYQPKFTENSRLINSKININLKF